MMPAALLLLLKYLPVLVAAVQSVSELIAKYQEIIERGRREGRPVSDAELDELEALRKAAVEGYEEAGQ